MEQNRKYLTHINLRVGIRFSINRRDSHEYITGKGFFQLLNKGDSSKLIGFCMRTFSILVFNAVGGMLGFELFDKSDAPGLKSVVQGKVRDIGGDSTFEWSNARVRASLHMKISDHREAADWVLEWMENLWPLGSLLEDLKIVAHRCINCTGDHTPAVMVGSRFQAGYPIVYRSDARCIIAASQQRLLDDVKLVVVFNVSNDSNHAPGRNEEAEIAELALGAVQVA